MSSDEDPGWICVILDDRTQGLGFRGSRRGFTEHRDLDIN